MRWLAFLLATIPGCTLPFDPALLDGGPASDGTRADAPIVCGGTTCAPCQRCVDATCVDVAVGEPCAGGRCALESAGGAVTCCTGCLTDDFCGGDSDGACGRGGETCRSCDGVTACVAGVCAVADPVVDASLQIFVGCFVTRSGVMRCRGDAGPGSLDGAATPTLSGDALVEGTWRAVSTGGGFVAFVCAINSSDELLCWGSNQDGRLGLGDTVDERRPRTRVGSSGFREIATSARGAACAISDGGTLHCWGNGSEGLIGRGVGVTAESPSVGLRGCTNWSHVSMSDRHACALCDGAVLCWGDNAGSRAGGPAGGAIWEPRMVPSALGFDRVSVGAFASCGLRRGDVACWGTSVDGDIVPDATFAEEAATDVTSDGGWTDVSVGGAPGDPGGMGCETASSSVTCGVQSGALFCWGSNCWAQLGTGDTTPRGGRVQVNVGPTSETDWARVVVGGVSVCALKTSGALYCWGDNSSFHLAPGGAATITRPMLIAPM